MGFLVLNSVLWLRGDAKANLIQYGYVQPFCEGTPSGMWTELISISFGSRAHCPR